MCRQAGIISVDSMDEMVYTIQALEMMPLPAGDRVAILAGNRVELLDAFFAAGKSGVVLVPLNTRLTARELEVLNGRV